jgi:hypothetical protein
MAEDKQTILIVCETCDARVQATVEGSYVEFEEGPSVSIRFLLLRCPECRSPLLASQNDEDGRYFAGAGDPDPWGGVERLYPDTRRRHLGVSVPEAIGKAFDEARACFETAKAYTACAIMCRKVLDGVCDSHDAKGDNLAQRVKDLAEQGVLDKRLLEWITAVRVVGNEAAHDINITVSREDASDLLDLAEAVTEYLYTFKEKFDAFQKRRHRREN